MGLSCCVRGTRRAEWWSGVRTDLCIPPIRAAKGWGTRTVAVPARGFGGMVDGGGSDGGCGCGGGLVGFGGGAGVGRGVRLEVGAGDAGFGEDEGEDRGVGGFVVDARRKRSARRVCIMRRIWSMVAPGVAR